MRHRAWAWLPFIFIVLGSSGAYAEGYLSKDFLLDTLFKLADNLPSSRDIYNARGTQEIRFMRALQDVDFSDLFVDPKNEGNAYSYNIFVPKTFWHVRSDYKNQKWKECKKIYLDQHNKVIGEKHLNISGMNFKPRHIPEDHWWFSYCMSVDRLTAPNTILYYFHGASGNPNNFFNRRAVSEVRRQWRQSAPSPYWVSVSMGGLALIGHPKKEKKFYEIVIPYLEKRLGFHDPDKVTRLGFGVSLGGANVANIITRRKDFFKVGVMICPALSVLDSYADEEAYKAYYSRTNAMPTVVRTAVFLFPNDIKDDRSLYQSLDPLTMGQRTLGPDSPPMFIQTSSKDEFGFDEGGKIFAMLARTKGAKIRFEPLVGRHCVLEPDKVVDFFLEHL